MLMKYIAYFIIALSLAHLQAFSKNGECLQQIYACEYYSCKIKETECDHGYLPDYALHYCTEMTEQLNPTLSQDGQIWLKQAAQCLRNKMENFENPLNCEEFATMAYNSHAPCYADHGFCDLSLRDLSLIFIYLKHEWLNPKTWIVFHKILNLCSQKKEVAKDDLLESDS